MSVSEEVYFLYTKKVVTRKISSLLLAKLTIRTFLMQSSKRMTKSFDWLKIAYAKVDERFSFAEMP